MMIIPDANVLIYAYDSTSPYHEKAKKWWEDVLSAEEQIGVPWIVVLAYTRLMTHPTLCAQPLTTVEVRENIQEWFDLSHVRLLSPTSTTLGLFFDLLADVGLGGNLTTDAMIAAHAIENRGTVFSSDHDFSRFQAIQWQNPIQSPQKNR
ncbi:MAG: TA system VapC family ribonuclease toxin [Verrucomicrobiota bacterium]